MKWIADKLGPLIRRRYKTIVQNVRAANMNLMPDNPSYEEPYAAAIEDVKETLNIPEEIVPEEIVYGTDQNGLALARLPCMVKRYKKVVTWEEDVRVERMVEAETASVTVVSRVKIDNKCRLSFIYGTNEHVFGEA